MKNAWLSLVFFMTWISTASAQNHWDFQGGRSVLDQVTWNRTIQTYNLSRFWLNEPLPEIQSGWLGGIGFNGVLLKGVYISPQVQYSSFRSAANNPNLNTLLRFRWINGTVAFDLFPLEFRLDTVRYRVRPFVRLGGGASLVMPRMLQNDSLVRVGGEAWQPMVWPFYYHVGLGVRVGLSRSVGLVFTATHSYYPSVNLRDFSTALNSNSLVGLQNDAIVNYWNFNLGLSLRLHPTEEDEEKKEEAKKLKRRRY